MAGVYGELIRARADEQLDDCLKSGRALFVQASLAVTGLIVAVAASAGSLPGLFIAVGLVAFITPVIWHLLWARSRTAAAQVEWMTSVGSWAGLVPDLVELPDDWNILEYLGTPVLVGPGGIVVLQNAESDSSKDMLGPVLDWAEQIGTRAGIAVRPISLTVGGYNGAEPIVGFASPGSRLSQMSPVLVSTDVKKWVSVALGLSSGQFVPAPYQQTSFDAVIKRRKPSRRKNPVLRALAKTVLIAVALATIGAVAFMIWRQPLLRVGLAVQSFLSGVVSPGTAARLGLPVTEKLSEGVIAATIKYGIAPRTSSDGAKTSGWLAEGSALIILDQVADKNNETWFYVRSGSAEGWAPLKAIRVMGVSKGTVLYPEADEHISTGEILVREAAAAALNHRRVPGREGTGWWEVVLPAGRRGWIKSDTNPLVFLGEGGK